MYHEASKRRRNYHKAPNVKQLKESLAAAARLWFYQNVLFYSSHTDGWIYWMAERMQKEGRSDGRRQDNSHISIASPQGEPERDRQKERERQTARRKDREVNCQSRKGRDRIQRRPFALL